MESYLDLLQRIDALNKNTFKFLSIYQASAVALAGSMFGLLLGYRNWGLAPEVARQGAIGLMWLVTLVAVFTTLPILVGLARGRKYRAEECALTDQIMRAGVRKESRLGDFVRWYETCVVLFIAASLVFLWSFGLAIILSATS